MNKVDDVPAIPKLYSIWQQDLSKSYLDLKFMGLVRSIEEAQTMLKAFNQCDKHQVESGNHGYFFKCEKIQNA